ncbi:MAG: hypothetical protein JWM83_1923 [Candidatus Angelobacter sp.]|nr:hypothetical protein [Candidatus Angelobacter sp.]
MSPLVAGLYSIGAIDRFFFVRYAMGGPQVRLRWRVTGDEAAAAAEHLLSSYVRAFLCAHPSRNSMPTEKIRELNRAMMQVDPSIPHQDDRIHPDNSWHAYPTRFEIGRYGGVHHLGHSLDVFCISSAQILGMMQKNQEPGEPWIRTALILSALQIAWGAARDEHDFQRLVHFYHAPQPLSSCANAGDLFYEQRSSELIAMAGRELERLVSGEPSALAQAGALLAENTRKAVTEAGRHYLITSHIHMTANRLGLRNAEEVYLSRILARTVEGLCKNEERQWQSLWKRRSGFLANALSTSLGQLAIDGLQSCSSDTP